MKKYIMLVVVTFILVAVLCYASLAFATETKEGLFNFTRVSVYGDRRFEDVTKNDWFLENIECVYELGIMSGNSLDTFNPKGNITQAEALTIAARVHKIYTTGHDDFSDIRKEMMDMEPEFLKWCDGDKESPAYKEFYEGWSAAYAYYIHKYGGYQEKNVYPKYPDFNLKHDGAPFIDAQKPISRKEFVTYLAAALPQSELQQLNVVENGKIPDVKYEDAPEVYLLYRAGVLTGKDSSGAFYAQSYITRAEVAAILGRMVKPELRKKAGASNRVEKKIIEITNADQLYALARLMSSRNIVTGVYSNDANYKYENDFAYFDIPSELTTSAEKCAYLQSASYKLMDDIAITVQSSNDSKRFVGIGSSKGGLTFKGTFDGNGKTITLRASGDLNISKTMSTNLGLFGKTVDAEILNTTVEISGAVTVKSVASTSAFCMGGLVGDAEMTRFDNCSVKFRKSDFGISYQKDEKDVSISYVGGIAGKSTRSVYSNCKVDMVDSTIYIKGDKLSLSTMYSMFSAGGILGFSGAGSNNTANIGRMGNQLYNCSFVSENTTQQDVISTAVTTGEELTVGGLVGCSFNNFTAKDCTVKIKNGNISAIKTGSTDTGSDYGTQTGGVIGRLEHTGRIYRCNVIGDHLKIISKSPNNWSSAGGVAGVDIGPRHRNVVSLDKCSFNGSGTSEISVEITALDQVPEKKRVTAGGIAGEGGYRVVGCSVKDVTIINKAQGISDNKAYAGDIVAAFNLKGSASAPLWKYEHFEPDDMGIFDCTSSGVKYSVADGVIINAQ